MIYIHDARQEIKTFATAAEDDDIRHSNSSFSQIRAWHSGKYPERLSASPLSIARPFTHRFKA